MILEELLKNHGAKILIHIPVELNERESRFRQLRDLGVKWGSNHAVFPISKKTYQYPDEVFFSIIKHFHGSGTKVAYYLCREPVKKGLPPEELPIVNIFKTSDSYEIF